MAKLVIKENEREAMTPGQGEAAKSSIEEAKAQSLFAKERKKPAEGPDYGYDRIRIHKKDEVNIYADQQDERYAMDVRLRRLIIMCVVAVVVFVVVLILPTNVFDVARYDRTIGGFASEIAAQFAGLIAFFRDPNSAYGMQVLTVVVTLLAGAAMGLSGGVFQGAMKNAIASPSTLGVTSGGTIGIIVYAVFMRPDSLEQNFVGSISDYDAALNQLGPVEYVLEIYGSFFATLIGCFIIVGLVMLIALGAGRGKVSNVSLVIAGQVFSSVILVVVEWIRQYYEMHGSEAIVAYLSQTTSTTFTGAYNVSSVLLFAVPLLICMVIIFVMAPRLSLLAFNDEEARSMGISTVATRNTMVAVCTVMTALVVAFCGAVGFVGFMVPHIARRIMGPDFRYLLPACALLGGILVMVVFYITELGIPYVISGSTGVFTSIIGCVMFLVIALRSRRSSHGDWV